MIELEPIGVGIGYRREIADLLEANVDRLDFVEVIADQFFDVRDAHLDTMLSTFHRVIPHGVGLSIASAAPLRLDYLEKMRALADRLQAPYYSDHLALTSVPGIDLGHLSPVSYTPESLALISRRVEQVQEYLGRPIALENLTHSFLLPPTTSPFDEAEFFAQLHQRTDCKILLDVTNVYITSVNMGFDPQAYLSLIPAAAVAQVHLAGGVLSNGQLIDSHSAPVPAEVWPLYETVCRRHRLPATLLERDTDFPDNPDELWDDLDTARAIWESATPSTA